MAAPDSLKRTAGEAKLEQVIHDEAIPSIESSSRTTSVDTQIKGQAVTTSLTHIGSRAGSLANGVCVTPVPSSPQPSAGSASKAEHNPAKRRKLTAAEKETARVEKEARELERALEKSRKADEKRVKDEEREVKRKAKEAEKQVKDEEKRKKEEERKAKEEEKSKKEKSQSRLNVFFAKPAVPTCESTGSPSRDLDDSLSSRRSSVASVDGPTFVSSRSSSCSPADLLKTDYERSFPSFFLQSHTTLAPCNRFLERQGTLNADLGTQTNTPNFLADKSNTSTFNLFASLREARPKRRRTSHLTVKEIMAQLRGESTKSADLTVPKSSEPPSGAEAVLQEVPVKYLRFAEDVRPPYIGTYTKCPAGVSDSKISRNPFSRVLPATNYDYDSEVEWEEPGEGEDLDSEGEEDMGEDEDNDDMDGFLDDEDAGDGIGGNKRRHIMGDLEPKLTGLCWEDADGKVQGNTGGVDLESMKLQVLLPTITGPIDPYSTAYWPSSNASSDQQLYNMNPPRVPLNALSGINSLQVGTSHFSSPFVSKSNSRQSNVKSTTTNTSSGPKKTIPADLMMDFKAAIEGSDLTKAGLIEVLKKKFPKTSKDAIKDALGTVAERVGAKEADKRWIIKTD